MKRTRLAIVGFGRLGRACADAVRERGDLELVGVVRRPASARSLPAPWSRLPVVGHARDLDRIDVVLLCVPPGDCEAAAHELLQQRFALVECAQIDAPHLAGYHEALVELALRHRSRAMLGAGWDPGVLTMVQGAFETLIPRGHSRSTRRPAASLHHTAAAEGVDGVRGALAVEYPGGDGGNRRYVYVELARGASLPKVSAAILSDPAFVGEPTEIFQVDSVAALEEDAHGVLLERLGTAASGAHQSLLLEARGDPAALAARAMLDAASRLPRMAVGGYRYFLSI